jgi:uncharacterized protein with PQ loop repeat
MAESLRMAVAVIGTSLIHYIIHTLLTLSCITNYYMIHKSLTHTKKMTHLNVNFLQEMLPQCPFMLHQCMLHNIINHKLFRDYESLNFIFFILIWFCSVTFKRVIRKKSTEEFSCVPYIIALLNCLLFTWYGLPIVSYKWENFPLVTVNGVGIVLELAYVLIYFLYSTPKGKVCTK